LVLAEIHESLEVVGVVDVRVVGKSADEAIACGDRRGGLPGAIVGVTQFQDGLLRVAPIGETGFQGLEELDRPRIISVDQRFVRELVELLGIEVRGLVDDVRQEAAAGERGQRETRDGLGKCAGECARQGD
jgi:hypothetical protein